LSDKEIREPVAEIRGLSTNNPEKSGVLLTDPGKSLRLVVFDG
jgi:hypothetical protein